MSHHPKQLNVYVTKVSCTKNLQEKLQFDSRCPVAIPTFYKVKELLFMIII
jgi:hypothetical protein